MPLLRGWRPALRIARREALRARGRSVLVLVMIGLPVLAIVALDTLARTSDVSTVEGLSRQIGSADARVSSSGSAAPVDQTPDMSSMNTLPSEENATPLPAPTTPDVRTALGPRARVVEVYFGRAAVRTAVGLARPDALGVDARDPIATGLLDLRSGRLPAVAGEVAVSERLAGRGFPVGSTLTLGSGTALTVVGVTEPTTSRGSNLLVGDPAALGLTTTGGTDSPAEVSWLVSRPGGVDWATVRQLNGLGLFVLSRSVVDSPPPASQVTVQDYGGGGLRGAELSVLALVVAMALLEVVLLAGPAFAVGARRQQRALALMAASGAEPPHLRRVVLASGVVLGGTAALAGALAGIGAAWVAVPAVQTFSSNRLGPFEVSPRDVAAIAACGLVSALLAALAPAVLAGRSDVVAVLAGRRGETRPGRRAPALGVVLLAAGVAGAAAGARRPSGGEVLITGAAILAVLGMVLLTPLVLAVLGRSARHLPLAARFAVRDAARHRSRTAPAVAAVAATVAGVVALGIGGISDAAQNRALYTPGAPMGAAVVQDYAADSATWAALQAAVGRELPRARTTVVHGVDESTDVMFRVEPRDGERPIYGSFSSTLGAGILVGPGALRGLRLPAEDQARARRALAGGDLVVFANTGHPEDDITLVAERIPPDGGESTTVGSWPRHAVVVWLPGSAQPAAAVIPAGLARAARMPVRTTALLLDRAAIDSAAEDRLSEAVGGLDENAFLYVERGFQDDSTRIILLLLGAIGGALVLGGTLTATFLALSDARPDFATMGAIGADPRTRRAVAAAYAGTIGLVGAVLGAAVGFVPGIAVTFPLTGSSWAGPDATSTDGTPIPGHFLDVPWLLVLGLVVVLPLVTATVVGLASRSRLPMVSRLS